MSNPPVAPFTNDNSSDEYVSAPTPQDVSIEMVQQHQTEPASILSKGKRRHKLIEPKLVWKKFTSDTLTNARMHTVHTSQRTLSIDLSSSFDKDRMTVDHATVSSPRSCGVEGKGTFVSLDSFGSIDDFMPENGSLGAAVFGIVKGTVGPAILYLPRGFQLSGWAVAIPSMLFATVMYIYNADRLLACWKAEHDRDLVLVQSQSKKHQQQIEQPMSHYNDTTTAATLHSPSMPMLLTYPELARRAFGSFSGLVDIGIASLQFGVCLTYLIFVPHNLYECALQLFGVEVQKEYFLLAMLLVEIPLSWIRDIRKLTRPNVIATVLIAYGLSFVLVMAFYEGMQYADDYYSNNKIVPTRVFVYNLKALPAITNSWFLFVGTSFFMMEGSITLLVPLQESVIREEDRSKFASMNRNVTAGIVFFYIAFSVICCAAFGDKIQTAMTASLEGLLAVTIQGAYSVAVVLTFPLQAFPAMEVVKNNLLGQPLSEDAKTARNLERNVLSTVVICVLGLFAVFAIDYLGNVVSILGSLFGIPLALIVPPLMHNILVTESSLLTRWMNYGVVLVGVFATGAASFATLVSWDKGAEES